MRGGDGPRHQTQAGNSLVDHDKRDARLRTARPLLDPAAEIENVLLADLRDVRRDRRIGVADRG